MAYHDICSIYFPYPFSKETQVRDISNEIIRTSLFKLYLMYQTKDDGSNVYKTRLLKLVVRLHYFNANVDFKTVFDLFPVL